MLLTLIISVLTVSAINGNPVPHIKNLLVLSKDNFFKDDSIVYTSQNKIINLVINMIGELDEDASDEFTLAPVVFFNQIHIDADGKEVELGQYVLQNATVHNVFDGRAATLDFGKPEVYFGAKDGLYSYNSKTKTAEKYGTVTDNIVHLDIANGTDDIYILTEPDYRIYKVTKKGTLKALVEAIPSARAFVLDRQHNIYYFGEDNLPYVLGKNSNKPTKIESFKDIKEAYLIRPPYIRSDPQTLFLADERVYVLNENGTSAFTDFKLDEKLSAISMEASPTHYFAIDGTIYGFDVIDVFFDEILSQIEEIYTEVETKFDSLLDFSNTII